MGDFCKPCIAKHRNKLLLPGERPDRVGQVDEIIPLPGKMPSPCGNAPPQVPVVEGPCRCPGRSGKLQDARRAARGQHAMDLAQRSRSVRHVANAIGHGHHIERPASKGHVLRIDRLRVHGHAACVAACQALPGNLEHGRRVIGEQHACRRLSPAHRKGHLARAARDVEHA